jgi:hypothetical protein
MKIKSLTLHVPSVKGPMPSISSGPRYKAWQERWKDERAAKNWEWSTTPGIMGAEAVVAIADDFEAALGNGANNVLVRMLTVLTLELPVEARSFTWTIALMPVAEKPASKVCLSMSIRPALAPVVSTAAVEMTVEATDDLDRQRLKSLGLLNTTRSLPKAAALDFLDASHRQSRHEPAADIAQWSVQSVHDALVQAQHRWPELSSPIQAMSVVAGFMMWRRGQKMKATHNELSLSGLTLGELPTEPELDAVLTVTQRDVPTQVPSSPSRRRLSH